MKKRAKPSRICALALALLMSAALVVQTCSLEVHAEQITREDMIAAVMPQIRAYGDSIDQNRADEKAAIDLASHGISGRGKTLNMSSSSPLTATLMNSKVIEEGFSIVVADAIQAMQRLDIKTGLKVFMNLDWYRNDQRYQAYVATDLNKIPDNLDWFLVYGYCQGSTNAYDSSLEWMVAHCEGHAVIEPIGNNGSEATYKVTLVLRDRFDFSTANTSGFKKLISGIGARLFREFDWNCTVTMNITVPVAYDYCAHTSGAYRWTYNSATRAMTSRGSDTYLQNNAVIHSRTHENGATHFYYMLDNTVRLLHDKPWVLEYDVLGPGRIAFSPVAQSTTKTYPMIRQVSGTYFQIMNGEYLETTGAGGVAEWKYAYGYSEANLYEQCAFQSNKYYTYRLENLVSEDGSNRIYLTVLDTQTGEVCLDRFPMDDYYYHNPLKDGKVLVSEESDWLSGKDIYINYLGNDSTGIEAQALDIRIWENGREDPQSSYWSVTQNTATCTEAGYAQKICTLCGKTEQEEVPALGHDFVNGSCSRCGEEAVISHTPGDINGDGKVNSKDATKLFQHLCGWNVEVVEPALDVNGDGKVNSKDATTLFQYLSGWDVEIH